MLKACLRHAALGPSGTGKTHASLGDEVMEARDERRLLRLPKQIVRHMLLNIDELGFVPPRKTGAEVLFELISQRYVRGATPAPRVTGDTFPPQPMTT